MESVLAQAEPQVEAQLAIEDRRLPVAGLVCAALVISWALIDPHAPDLAAQVYRVDLFKRAGLVLFDTHWYAGHDMPGYSLLFPWLASVIGIRLLGAISVICSALLFERCAASIYGHRARWGAVLFAVAAAGDLWLGRVTFALGVTFAMAAMLCMLRGRPTAAGAFALLSAAASPVAGLLLCIAAVTALLHTRKSRPWLAGIIPAVCLPVTLALLFPEGGFEPFRLMSFGATVGVVLVFLTCLPRSERALRLGGVLYLAACVMCLLVHTPMGSNVERYGVLLASPLLLCAAIANGDGPSAFQLLGVAAIATWMLWGPVRETRAIVANPSTDPSYFQPVERFLATHDANLIRVEMPLTRSHWESDLLAAHVSLARGWEKQLDERYNSPLLDDRLTAASYRQWLHRQAVSYVVLADVALDPSSAAEGELIRRGLPYLRLVEHSAHWRIYEVLDATPIVTGPGQLIRLGVDRFVVRARHAGSLLVRIHYTPYWQLIAGHGCVSQASEGWTSLSSTGAQTIVVAARFTLGAVFGHAEQCA